VIKKDQSILSTNKCRQCQSRLHRDILNSKVDVLTCQNDLCPLFRQPQGCIPDERNAKFFPRNVQEVVSAATEAQRDRRARETITQGKTTQGLICDNCGAKITRYDAPSVVARRKHTFCSNKCKHEYHRKHPKR
jgi:hypothetical protein